MSNSITARLALPLATARRGSPPMAAMAVFLLLTMIPTALAGLIDDRLFNGINIWIKPLKFQFSLAVYLLTMAWTMLALPEQLRRSRMMTVLAWALVVTAFVEAGYIALQASRGAGSHYNLSGPWTTFMYQMMGVGAFILVAGAIWLGVLMLRHGNRSNLVVFSAAIGLILGGVLGGVVGSWMARQPGHWVGTEPSDAAGLWLLGWSTSGGDLRVAHFFGLHLMQALPAIAWVAERLVPAFGRQAVFVSAAGGVALTVATFVQALAGRPFIPF